MIRKICLAALLGSAAMIGGATLTGCGGAAVATPTGISPEKFADGVCAVMLADRKVYARDVVTRLKDQKAPVKPDEYWTQWEEEQTHMLPLPAQMFRMGAEIVNEGDNGFKYSLKSLWPLNPQHKPTDEEEIEALTYLSEHPGETYKTEKEINGKKTFVKYYPDRAVAKACWECHNEHENRDFDTYPEFKEGDVMGAIAVFVPLED